MWNNLPFFPETASSHAAEVDLLTFTWIAISVFFSILVTTVLIWFAVKYRRRTSDEIGQPEKTGIWLEIVWSVIPMLILLGMFVWGAKLFIRVYRPPANAVEYFVTGKQWMWKFQHPEGNREINELHVPLGQPIKLTMTSEDVIHSFFVPAFRVKADVVPGRYTHLWFEANKVGTFRLYCAEFCGAGHSMMTGSIIVMEPRTYERWLAQGAPGPAVTASGEEIFTAKTCNTCHRPDSSALAPFLEGLWEHEIELSTGEVVVADANYIRQSILDPASQLVKGYNALMPTYQGQLTEEELVQLISYVRSLTESDTEQAEDASTADADTSTNVASGE